MKKLKITLCFLVVQIPFLLVWISSHWVSIYSTAGFGTFVFVLPNQPDSTTLEIMHMNRLVGDGWIPFLNDRSLSKHSSGPFFEPKSFSDTLGGAFTLDIKGGPTAKVAIPYWLIAGIPAVAMLAFLTYSKSSAQNKPRHSSPDSTEPK